MESEPKIVKESLEVEQLEKSVDELTSLAQKGINSIDEKLILIEDEQKKTKLALLRKNLKRQFFYILG